MVITDTLAIAIEAKWIEPPDRQTIAKRIARGESDGADPRKTIEGWLDRIEPFTSHARRADDFMDVIYQNSHRTASAGTVAKDKGLRPEVVYLHFHPSPSKSAASTAMYVDDLRKLHRRLGGRSGLGFRVIGMPLDPTPSFDAVKELDRRAGATSDAVKAALLSGPLFTFGASILTNAAIASAGAVCLDRRLD